MNNEMKTFVLLTASAINRTVLDPDIIKTIDLDKIYQISRIHQMTALIGHALKHAGMQDPRFEQGYYEAIQHAVILDTERMAVTKALDEAQIWYMPLKGIVLKDYYPIIGMRQMSDNDILYDASKSDEVKTIMETLGFIPTHFSDGHQDDYRKPPLIHFEMHRLLVPMSESRLYKYYKNIETKLLTGNGFERHFTKEDFYIYMIAHEYKHFYWTGTGIRPLLDIYVFLQKHRDELNWVYIKSELDKIGISDFEEKNREMALKVFNKDTDLDQLNSEQIELLTNLYTAGLFGSTECGIQNKVKLLGKVHYVLRRIFLPLNTVEICYPFFYRHKFLLPLLPCYRMFGKWRNIALEIKTIRKL